MFYSFGGLDTIGASPEVARDVLIADRNRRLANLTIDSLFESELKSFRLALIEQRKHLLLAYESTADNDICKIILILLNSADAFLKLLAIENGPLGEWPRNTVEEKMGIGTGVTLIPGEKNARRNGVHGTYVMEHDFGRNSQKEIIKGNSGIDPTTSG